MNIKKIVKQLYNSLPLKRQVYSVIRKIKVPPKKIYEHLHFKGWFTVSARENKFRIYHYGYQIENEIFWNGLDGWERQSLRLWIKLSEISDVIIDIGANTGICALIAKSVNPASKVFAYEPVLRVFDKLVRNIRKNKFDINAEEIAISNYEGEATIYDQPTEHVYSVTVNENLALGSIPTIIKTKRLSGIIRENDLTKIDLIKIDVETHEAEVLEGMGEYLGAFKPILLIEILTDKVAKRVGEILGSLDYKYYEIDEFNSVVISHTVSGAETKSRK